MRFGLVWLTFKIKTELNQTNVVLVGWVVAVFCETIQFFIFNIKIKLKTTYFQQCFKFDLILKFHFHPTMYPST